MNGDKTKDIEILECFITGFWWLQFSSCENLALKMNIKPSTQINGGLVLSLCLHDSLQVFIMEATGQQLLQCPDLQH